MDSNREASLASCFECSGPTQYQSPGNLSMTASQRTTDTDASWFLIPSSNSSITTCTESDVLDHRLLTDAQKEMLSRNASRHSPKNAGCPGVNFDRMRKHLNEDVLPPGKNCDWLWDWSSRPEVPHMRGSQLMLAPDGPVTPPNSPAPSPSDYAWWKVRHNKALSSKLFSVDVLSVLVFSNLLALFVGMGLGFLLAKQQYNDAEL